MLPLDDFFEVSVSLDFQFWCRLFDEYFLKFSSILFRWIYLRLWGYRTCSDYWLGSAKFDRKTSEWIISFCALFAKSNFELLSIIQWNIFVLKHGPASYIEPVKHFRSTFGSLNLFWLNLYCMSVFHWVCMCPHECLRLLCSPGVTNKIYQSCKAKGCNLPLTLYSLISISVAFVRFFRIPRKSKWCYHMFVV